MMYRRCGKSRCKCCRCYKCCKCCKRNTSGKEEFIKLLNKNREAVSKEEEFDFSNVKIQK